MPKATKSNQHKYKHLYDCCQLWNSMNKVELRVIPGIKREKEIIGRDWSKIQELSKLEEYSQVSKRGFEQVLCGTKLFITIYNCICQLQGQTNQTFAEGQV